MKRANEACSGMSPAWTAQRPPGQTAGSQPRGLGLRPCGDSASAGCSRKGDRGAPVEGRARDRKASSACQLRGWTSAEESCPVHCIALLSPSPGGIPSLIPDQAGVAGSGGPANTTTWPTSKPNFPPAPPASPLHWCRTWEHFLTNICTLSISDLLPSLSAIIMSGVIPKQEAVGWVSLLEHPCLDTSLATAQVMIQLGMSISGQGGPYSTSRIRATGELGLC